MTRTGNGLSPELKSWIDSVLCAVLQPFFAGIGTSGDVDEH